VKSVAIVSLFITICNSFLNVLLFAYIKANSEVVIRSLFTANPHHNFVTEDVQKFIPPFSKMINTIISKYSGRNTEISLLNHDLEGHLRSSELPLFNSYIICYFLMTRGHWKSSIRWSAYELLLAFCSSCPYLVSFLRSRDICQTPPILAYPMYFALLRPLWGDPFEFLQRLWLLASKLEPIGYCVALFA